MSILNFKQATAPEPTPAADALARHKADRAEQQAKQTDLAQKDSQASLVISGKQTNDNVLAGARQRRLDLLAAQELGATNESDVAACEHEIQAAEQRATELAESAAIAERKRKLLKPLIDAVRQAIGKFDGQWKPRLGAVHDESMIGLAAEFATAQAKFLDVYSKLWAHALRRDVLQIPSVDPLSARHAHNELTVPIPQLPELKALAFNRVTLAKAIIAEADRIEKELAQ